VTTFDDDDVKQEDKRRLKELTKNPIP